MSATEEEYDQLRARCARAEAEAARLKEERDRCRTALQAIGTMASAAADVTRPFNAHDAISTHYPRPRPLPPGGP